MKVIKRDGRAVDYDRTKIQIAIEKANQEVLLAQRASTEDIQGIITYIEELNKKRILVEDIQDIIEEKLMELKKYELAKKYIVYRYTRALVRKQNTTDETILGIIRNNNGENKDIIDNMTVALQRNYIANEVSRDLTKRLLLPEKIAKAIDEGIIYFHNSDYFVNPVIHSCIINLDDMLENGTAINGIKIEKPKSFEVACIVITQIIMASISNQSGQQVININHLGKYLRKSYEKIRKEVEKEYKIESNIEIARIVKNRVKSEIRSGIQIMQYQLNTLMEMNGKSKDVTLFLNLEENDPYILENAYIMEEILNKQYEGEEEKPIFSKIVYVLSELNSLKGNKYDYLTKVALEVSKKNKSIYYISSVKMKEKFEGNVFCPMENGNFLKTWKDNDNKYRFEGRFDQGIVSINLAQIAIIANKSEKKFMEILDERLEICYEALMCRHYSLIGIKSDASPIHWRYGAISRLCKEENVDKLLYGGYSTLSLGYIGINEMTEIVKEQSIFEEEGHKFQLKVIKHLNEVIKKWEEKTNIKFALCISESKSARKQLVKIDREKFGIIKGITDKEEYILEEKIKDNKEDKIYERLSLENEINSILEGGISFINLTKNLDLEKVIKYISDNTMYAKLI